MGFRKKKNQRGHKVKGTFKVMQKFEIESKSKRGDKQSIQKREKLWSNTKREVFISECMHSSTVFPSKAVWHSYYSKVVIVSNHNKNTHTTVLMKKKKKIRPERKNHWTEVIFSWLQQHFLKFRHKLWAQHSFILVNVTW